MLADVEPGTDEAESTHLAAQPQQVAVRDRVASVVAKTRVEKIEVGDQAIDRAIGGGFPLEGRPEPAPDEGELAPVRFVPGSGRQRVGVRLQLAFIAPNRRRQFVADGGQAGRLTQVPRQLAHPLAVTGQQRPALQAERLREHRSVGIRVAILVAADPGSQADERMDRQADSRVMASQRFPELLMDVRDGVEKCPLQVEDRIAHFIEHARPHGPDLVGVPEDLHVGRHSLPDPVALVGREWSPKQRQLLTDPVLVVEDAASHGLRRVSGQHRPDLEVLENGGELRFGDVLLHQLSHRVVEIAASIVGLGDGSRLPFQLGEVDQLEVRGKGPNQPGRVIERNAPEIGDQGGLLAGVVPLAEFLGAQPNRLLELIERHALVLA